VATTAIVADWAREVGGDRVEVTQLLDPLVDPHEYEPTPRDAERLADADVLLASGAGLDDWAGDLVETAGGPNAVEVAPEVGDDDPHFWHDPTLAAEAVRTIESALVSADPDGAGSYGANAEEYVGRLEALDRELLAEVETVPAERRRLVTDHDAFGHLADHFGIEVVGAAVPSTSTAAEPDARETAELIETIRAEGVCALFSESSVDPKLIEQIAAETGARVVPDLYGDTLGPDGSGAETYLSMMRHNVRVLVEGLDC
jgi:zinc/manganese transport system substrate-binding protein/manganese/iron transport system substrate-binding protein